MEYERVREQIAKSSYDKWEYYRRGRKGDGWDNEGIGIKSIFYDFAEEILSLVEIKSDDQSLPKLREFIDLPQYHNKLSCPYTQGQIDTQTDMTEDDFIRVIPKRK